MSLELLNEALEGIKNEKISDDLYQRIQELADKDMGWMMILEAIEELSMNGDYSFLTYIEGAEMFWSEEDDQKEYREAIKRCIQSYIPGWEPFEWSDET